MSKVSVPSVAWVRMALIASGRSPKGLPQRSKSMKRMMVS